MSDEPDLTWAKVAPIVQQIGTILRNQSFDAQGAIIANLLAVWVAGHVRKSGRDPSDIRREAMIGVIEMAQLLVPIVDEAYRRTHEIKPGTTKQ